jgi:hypothetical protein
LVIKKKDISLYFWLVLNFSYSVYGHIHYIRRGISFLIAFKMGKSFSRFWKYNFAYFTELKLRSSFLLDIEKLRSYSNQNFIFLGYTIINYFSKKLIEIRGFSWILSIFLKKREISTEIPIFYIIHDLSKINLCNTKGFPTHKAAWSTFNDHYIILIYSDLWVNLLLYYSGSSNQFDLAQIQYILEFSCIKTLAFKHKSSIRWTWEQYRRYVSFSDLAKNLIKNSKFSLDIDFLLKKKYKFWFLELYTINYFIACLINY